jgi:hypothetical protein
MFVALSKQLFVSEREIKMKKEKYFPDHIEKSNRMDMVTGTVAVWFAK